jgi:hypothetical protein
MATIGTHSPTSCRTPLVVSTLTSACVNTLAPRGPGRPKEDVGGGGDCGHGLFVRFRRHARPLPRSLRAPSADSPSPRPGRSESAGTTRRGADPDGHRRRFRHPEGMGSVRARGIDLRRTTRRSSLRSGLDELRLAVFLAEAGVSARASEPQLITRQQRARFGMTPRAREKRVGESKPVRQAVAQDEAAARSRRFDGPARRRCLAVEALAKAVLMNLARKPLSVALTISRPAMLAAGPAPSTCYGGRPGNPGRRRRRRAPSPTSGSSKCIAAALGGMALVATFSGARQGPNRVPPRKKRSPVIQHPF